jgi:FAD synthase
VAVIAEHIVVAVAAVDLVSATTAVEGVVTAKPDDEFTVIATEDRVVIVIANEPFVGFEDRFLEVFDVGVAGDDLGERARLDFSQEIRGIGQTVLVIEAVAIAQSGKLVN